MADWFSPVATPAPAGLDLRTIRNVELIHAGTWDISTGSWTVTPEHLQSAVAAHEAKILRRPVLKLGHIDPRFDGSPALGYIDNLRIVNAGKTLVGDYVGVPAKVAELIPHAYPDRSVEGWNDYQAPDGVMWPFVLTDVALLGATGPGIEALQSLQDVQDLYGIAAKRIETRPKVAVRQSDKAAHDHTLVLAAARRRRTNRKRF